jgi:hypothetical protein
MEAVQLALRQRSYSSALKPSHTSFLPSGRRLVVKNLLDSLPVLLCIPRALKFRVASVVNWLQYPVRIIGKPGRPDGLGGRGDEQVPGKTRL